MFNKSSNWWFGKNSIFGQIIRQTKYGIGNNGDIGGYTPYRSESDILKYGMMFALFYLLAKK